MKNHFSILVICAIFCCSPRILQAQHREDLNEIRQEVGNLKDDINSLNERLQQLINRLNSAGFSDSSGVKPASQQGPSPDEIDVIGFPAQGSEQSKVAIIEFADFDCPFCRHYKNDIYPRIFADYIKTGKIKYFWQDFPLRIHAQALWAARAARCAGEQGKFWEMRDVLFKAFPDSSEQAVLAQAGTSAIEINKLSECLSSQRYRNEVFQSIAEGQRLGVDSTPTFLLGTFDPDHPGVLRISKVIRGAYPFPVFKVALDELLASHGQQQTSSAHYQLPQ